MLPTGIQCFGQNDIAANSVGMDLYLVRRRNSWMDIYASFARRVSCYWTLGDHSKDHAKVYVTTHSLNLVWYHIG